MKRLTVLRVTMAIVGLATSAAMVAAQEARSDAPAKVRRACDAGTLKGKYGFMLSGLRPGPGGVPEQFVGVAMATFDGQGSFTQVDNIHGLSGAVTDREGWGSYTVAPDCSGTTTLWTNGLPFPLEMRFVIVDHGEEVRTAVMAPAPIVVTSVGRKVF